MVGGVFAMSKQQTLSKIHDLLNQLRKDDHMIEDHTRSILPEESGMPRLSHAAKKILDTLAQHEGTMNQRTLSKCVGVSPQATSVQVRRLERYGYLERTDGTQKNENFVGVTELGRQVGLALNETMRFHAEHILCDLSPEEGELLLELLNKIRTF